MTKSQSSILSSAHSVAVTNPMRRAKSRIHSTMWYYRDAEFDPKEGELDPKKNIGFVYLITNLVNGKMYVGKKRFWSSRSKQVKGKKKKFKAESDWRTYYGSNALIQQDVKDLGEASFRREILYLCSSLSECSYLEAYEQFTRKAILSPAYYNDWLMVKVTRKHLKNLQIKDVQGP